MRYKNYSPTYYCNLLQYLLKHNILGIDNGSIRIFIRPVNDIFNCDAIQLLNMFDRLTGIYDWNIKQKYTSKEHFYKEFRLRERPKWMRK